MKATLGLLLLLGTLPLATLACDDSKAASDDRSEKATDDKSDSAGDTKPASDGASGGKLETLKTFKKELKTKPFEEAVAEVEKVMGKVLKVQGNFHNWGLVAKDGKCIHFVLVETGGHVSQVQLDVYSEDDRGHGWCKQLGAPSE